MLSLVNFFKALSDETRLRCLVLLQAQKELCVCELTAALDLSQPKISRHLAHLRQLGLILDERKGQWVFYQINAELPDWTFKILTETTTASNQDMLFKEDLIRLKTMTDRPDKDNCC